MGTQHKNCLVPNFCHNFGSLWHLPQPYGYSVHAHYILSTMPFHPRRRRRRGRRARRRPRAMRRTRRVALDPERKTVDVTISFNPENGGDIFLLNGVVQGAADEDRIGNQQLNLSLGVNFIITNNLAAGAPNNVTRMALMWDMQPQGALPAVADIWTHVGSSSVVVGHRIIPHALRFKTLWTRTVMTTVNGSGVQKRFKMFKTFRVKTRYSAGGSGIGNIQSGALLLVVAAEQATAGDRPSLLFASRVRYVG